MQLRPTWLAGLLAAVTISPALALAGCQAVVSTHAGAVAQSPVPLPPDTGQAAGEGAGEDRGEVPPPDPTALPNPPIPESFLYRSPLLEIMVPGTVWRLDDDGGDRDGSAPFRATGTYNAGVLMDQSGRPTDAYERFLEAVERDPDSTWLKYRAARAALGVGALDKAEELAAEILDTNPQDTRAMLAMASVNLYRDRGDKAREWYERVIDVQPRNVEALVNLADMAFRQDRDMERTIEYCDRILTTVGRGNGAFGHALVLHSEASALAGDIETAAEMYRQLLRFRPVLINRLRDMANRLVRMGRTDDALELLRAGVLMAPEAVSVRQQWETLLAAEKGERAVREAYAEMCEVNPSDISVLELYAGYLGRVGDFERLEAHRQRMLGVDARHVPSLLSLAAIAMERGDVEGATALFERALVAGPNDPDIYRDIALLYIEQGKLERAGDLLRSAFALNPQDENTLVALAALHERLGDDEEAERFLKRALDAAPAKGELLSLLAEFYLGRDRLREAASVLEQVRAVNPQDMVALMQLAQIYLQEEDGEALDRIETVLRGGPSSAPLRQYGMLAMEHAAWDRARRAFEPLLDEVPQDLRVRNFLATCYAHLGEAERAAETLEAGEAHAEGDLLGTLRLLLVQLYSDLGMHDDRVELLSEMADADGGDFVLRSMFVSALASAGRGEEAREELSAAVRDFAVEEPVGTQMLRADILSALGEPERAVSILRSLLADDPENLQVEFALANVFNELRDVENAERLYLRLIDKTAGSPEQAGIYINSLNNLAYLYAVEQVKLDEAEVLARRAVTLRPNSDYILDTMGWVYYQMGDYDRAERYLLRAVRRALRDAEIKEHLGDLYVARQEPAKARVYYEMALEAAPDSAAVREKLRQLEPAVSGAAQKDS